MKVKVTIINTWYILVSEAVTVSNVVAIVSLVPEIWLATERQTDRHTPTPTPARMHAQTRPVYVKISKIDYDFANKRTSVFVAV